MQTFSPFMFLFTFFYSRAWHFDVAKPLAITIANPFSKTLSTHVILIGQHFTRIYTHAHMCCQFQFVRRLFQLFLNSFLLSCFPSSHKHNGASASYKPSFDECNRKCRYQAIWLTRRLSMFAWVQKLSLFSNIEAGNRG